jgi:hypothetical protein
MLGFRNYKKHLRKPHKATQIGLGTCKIFLYYSQIDFRKGVKYMIWRLHCRQTEKLWI